MCFIIIILIILFFIYSRDVLTIRNNGWVLYYTPSCPFCVKQLEEFGWKSVLLKKVNCEEKKCPDIESYPTWINTKSGKKIEGVAKLNKLL